MDTITAPLAQTHAARASTAFLTDHYELTMLQSALSSGLGQRRAVFEVFARKLPTGRRFGVVSGMSRLMDLIRDFRFGPEELAHLASKGVVDAVTRSWLADYQFTGSIDGYQDGEVYFPSSPILTVEATFAEAVLLETLILSVLNHDCAIAGAASRMVIAAGDRPLLEMGGRRAHEQAAVDCARVAYSMGFSATSNLEAGRRYGVPTRGTSAHAFTLGHAAFGGGEVEAELSAFRAQVAAFGPGTTLLVDTFDTERGIRHAVEVAGSGLGAVRIDSGDLALEARRARTLLDSLGATSTKVVVTGDLDEHSISALADAPVDLYGVGTSLVTGSGAPTASMVYKLVAIAEDDSPTSGLRPVAKNAAGKASHGGRKFSLRRLDEDALAISEEVALDLPSYRQDVAGAAPSRLLQVPMMRRGEKIYSPTLDEVRHHHTNVLAELPAQARDIAPGSAVIPTNLTGL